MTVSCSTPLHDPIKQISELIYAEVSASLSRKGILPDAVMKGAFDNHIDGTVFKGIYARSSEESFLEKDFKRLFLESCPAKEFSRSFISRHTLLVKQPYGELTMIGEIVVLNKDCGGYSLKCQRFKEDLKFNSSIEGEIKEDETSTQPVLEG